MKTAVMVLGIIGGVFGILGALLALAVGGVIDSVVGGHGGSIIALLAMVAAVFGILGACAKDKPGFSTLAMIVAGVLGFLLVKWFFVVAAPLFLIGGVIAYMARNEQIAVS